MEIKRDLHLNRLVQSKHNGMIKVVTGGRRCGKSYLLFKLFYNHLVQEGIATDHIIMVDWKTGETAGYAILMNCWLILTAR